MELIIEALCDLIIEGSIGLTESKRVPLLIRILSAFFIFLVFAAVLLVIGFMGVSILREKLWAGIAVLVFDALLAVLFVRKIVKTIRR